MSCCESSVFGSRGTMGLRLPSGHRWATSSAWRRVHLPTSPFLTGFAQDGTLTCNWFMPFATKARIGIVNQGNETRKVSVYVGYNMSLKQPMSAYGYFHAKWHRDALLNQELSRTIDWPILKTQGRGRYVGTQMHIWNARHGWWGEGDEKIFRRRREIPLHLRHRQRRLLRIRLVRYRAFRQGLPRPKRMLEGQHRQHQSPPLATRRQHSLPAVLRRRHRKVFLQPPPHDLRRHRLLVPRARRHRSV